MGRGITAGGKYQVCTHAPLHCIPILPLPALAPTTSPLPSSLTPGVAGYNRPMSPLPHPTPRSPSPLPPLPPLPSSLTPGVAGFKVQLWSPPESPCSPHPPRSPASHPLAPLPPSPPLPLTPVVVGFEVQPQSAPIAPCNSLPPPTPPPLRPQLPTTRPSLPHPRCCWVCSTAPACRLSCRHRRVEACHWLHTHIHRHGLRCGLKACIILYRFLNV